MAMPTDVLKIGGVDISTKGFGVRNPAAWWSGVTQSRGYVSPIEASRAYSAAVSVVEPRIWAPEFLWLGSLAERVGALDELRWMLPHDMDVSFEFGDDTRLAYGRRLGDMGDILDRQWVAGDVICQPQIVFYDPKKYDAVETVLDLSSSPTEMALGTYPGHWVWLIDSGATNPQLIVEYENEQIYSLLLDGTVSGQWSVDSEEHTIEIVDGAAIPSALAAGAGFFLPIGGSGMKTVSVSQSNGTGTLTYRRVWG